MQDTTRIHVAADTKEELIQRINKVNELYKIYDIHDRNVILTPHDLDEIFQGLDYDL